MFRRDFLVRTGLLISTGAIISCTSRTLGMDPGSLAEWQDVRDQFLLTKERIHMAGFLLASHPKPVREAIEKHRKALDENPAEYWEHVFPDAEAKVLKPIAEYLNADPGEIASTTPYPVSYARLSPGLLNNEAEVETTLAAVGGLV